MLIYPGCNNFKVAISFDDGPDYKYTQKYIDILKKYNAKATFFVVGKNVEENPELLRLLNDNKFEIGIHSYSHKNMMEMQESQIEEELRRSLTDVYSIIKQRVTLFRPPYGAFNDNVKDIAQKLGLKIILWDLDSLDWKGISCENIIHRVEKNIGGNSIILMHEGRENTLGALSFVLHKLQNKGYEFVTVSELLAMR